MEGRFEITLPGSRLAAKPVDEKSPLILRIADTRLHGALTWYDLRYIGLEPGAYDLRDQLHREDGSPLGELPPLRVEVVGLLPATHSGELVEPPPRLLGLFGGYRNTLIAVAILWLLVAVSLWLSGRRRRPTAPSPVVDLAPTLAERLRPLVERAAAGTLDTDGQAQLERLLLSHWRERLGLGELTQADAIAVLRRHPDAGALLHALENWLHRPPGVAHVDLAALLAPYREPVPIESPAKET
jgi:hypothetical protein